MGALPLPTQGEKHTLVAHVAALHHSSALLVRYKIGPDNQQGWFLPNDDLHHLEHPEQGAMRILKEQAGIDDATLKLAEVESFAGDNQTWHLIFDYLAFTRTMKVSPGNAVAELRCSRSTNCLHQKTSRTTAGEEQS